jgi:uncharacterized protein (DUF362 family)
VLGLAGLEELVRAAGRTAQQFHQDIHEIISDLSLMIRPTLTIVDGDHMLMENGPTGGDPTYVSAR